MLRHAGFSDVLLGVVA